MLGNLYDSCMLIQSISLPLLIRRPGGTLSASSLHVETMLVCYDDEGSASSSHQRMTRSAGKPHKTLQPRDVQYALQGRSALLAYGVRNTYFAETITWNDRAYEMLAG